MHFHSDFRLSVELCSDPSHFVLELIQNLDDTVYPTSVNPTATFQLQGKPLTVESNQSGFTEEDVFAICDMGQSSKRPASGAIKDSIGEKGIGIISSDIADTGFRSVFAAANRVQIFSNMYNFEFDRGRPLGMVCPVELQQAGPPGKAIFVLHLSVDDEGLTKLQETLTELDPDMSLFLRRLRCLQVIINGTRMVKQMQYQREICVH